MKKLKLEVKHYQKGITLIALVITIIVLLILAGVTIATLVGDNGILTKVNEAKTETEQSEEEELRRLTALEAATNLENQLYKDKNEDTVTIPAGFAVSQVEGENTIADGLVIIDKNENEFVWVPVNFEEFKRYDFKNNSEVSALFSEPTSDGIKNETEVEKMYYSVNKYKGFYVGRYEAGTTADILNEEGTETKGIRGELVSKKGANVYNYIGFSDSDDIDNEYGGAVEVARKMYTEEKGDSVKSTLIYGVQWDAIMRWMKDVPNLTGGKYVQDSTGMGWYSGTSGNSKHQTGIDFNGGKNKVKNIYDLAGHVWEWTMESYYTGLRVDRGGFWGASGFDAPASHRSNTNSSNISPYVGFRVALYLL